MSVLLETTLGDIVIDLYTKDRPRSTLNFLKLCKLKMYNYCLVHCVQRNFVIQTGDIDQKGGCSVFKVLYGEQAKLFEKEDVPKVKHSQKLTVSMVNDGNGYHGSQFLITTTENADALDGLHTVFGVVSEGEEVVQQINECYCDEEGRPFQDIRIHHTIVLHDPFEDPQLLPVPPRSPSPPPYVIESDRLAVGETVNKLAGHSTEEVVEFIEEKELKANTQMLEIIGDIPDAEMKPPENVLFVCKLNPVTSSDDLEIIFSRFGTMESCEVIRDWKTGDSLCYAFIEFVDVTACEAAYFKMDNVLIDERRVHVDFSQSVSKLYWNRNTKNQLKYSAQNNSGIGDNRSRDQRRSHDDHIRSRRNDDHIKARRDDDHIKSRRDDDHIKSRRDDDHIKSRRDDDHIKSRRDDDHIKSRRDDDHIKSRRDDDHIKSRRDDDHIKSKRGDGHVKPRRGDRDEYSPDSVKDVKADRCGKEHERGSKNRENKEVCREDGKDNRKRIKELDKKHRRREKDQAITGGKYKTELEEGGLSDEKSKQRSDSKYRDSSGSVSTDKDSKKKRGREERDPHPSWSKLQTKEEENAKARELQTKIRNLERKIRVMKAEELEESSLPPHVKKHKKTKHRK